MASLAASDSGTAQESGPEEAGWLIAQGTRLHDRGDYEAALAKYREALRLEPENTAAIYEISLTYSAQKDWQLCYENAESALELRSPHRVLLYTVAGNCRDGAGQSERAIKLYERGLKVAPDDAGLHFNLAITYLATGKTERAREHFESTLRSNPSHVKATLALADLYLKSGLRGPALLALFHALLLEPDSKRSFAAAGMTMHLITAGVSMTSPTEFKVEIRAQPKKGPYDRLELVLPLVVASWNTEESRAKPRAQLVAETLGMVFDILEEQPLAEKRGAFAQRQFLPLFLEMKERGLLEPFTHRALSSLKLEGSEKWLADNPVKVRAFETWRASRVKGSR